MVIYFIVFAIIILLAVPLEMRSPTKAKKAVYLGIVFVILYLISILRYGIGSDYYSYMRVFDKIAAAPFGEIFSQGIEPLFALLTKLISLFTDNADVMYAIYAALILAPVAIMIYRHSEKAWLSVTAYYCLTLFYTSLNFIRQSLAVSVLILAYGFIKKKKVLPVLILGVTAVLLHYTAAIFIPFYLLSLIKPTKKYMIIYGSVSVGVFAIVMIMTAAGANPLNLVAKLATAVLGKDYSSYIDTVWFTGFGPEYLIMPLAMLAFVLISYFSGWKERPEADTLLQFTLFNATVWLFVMYAFIIERFSMFVFIFQLFTVPSICGYFAEKAEEAEKLEKSDKKIPGYSKKKAEEKKDNSFLITVAVAAGMFFYNCFGLVRNFHYIVPYGCNIPQIEDALDGFDGAEDSRRLIEYNKNPYVYLVGLKGAECDYIMLSTGDNFTGITPGVIRAGEYAGADIKALMNDPSASNAVFYTDAGRTKKESWNGSGSASNGASVSFDADKVRVTDINGKTAEVEYGRLAFLLMESDGSIFDGTAYDLSDYANLYEGESHKIPIRAAGAA